MTTFISYASSDSAFASKLTMDLRATKVHVWMAELDIPKGARWDREIQSALERCTQLVLVLSPAAEKSENVLDEVAFALEENRPVIPLLLMPCRKPYRVIRLQHIDFTSDYVAAFSSLLTVLKEAPSPVQTRPSPRRLFVSCSYKEYQIRESIFRIARELGLEPIEAMSLSSTGPIREGIVQLISTCDFVVSVLTASNEEEPNPWLLWELGVATSMGLPTQVLVHGDVATRVAHRLFLERQLHDFTHANLAQKVRTALEHIASLPPKPTTKWATSDA
jgi:hypothetical protein